MKQNDSTPKNSATTCRVDHRFSKAVFSFASGTFSKKEIRAMFKELHPLEILCATISKRRRGENGQAL
jgi:hypothetical protein